MTGPGQLAVVLALGATQTLAWASTTYLPAILAGPMARDLGVSRASVFGAFSVALVVMAALGPWVGRRIDQGGGRAMLLGSHLVMAAGLALLGAAPQVGLLFIAWCVLGAGMAMGLYDAAFAVLVRIYGSEARRPITGITLIGGFASTLGWPLTAYLDGAIGWRGTCWVWAALHLLLALPLSWRMIPKAAPLPPTASSLLALPQGCGPTTSTETPLQRAARRRSLVWLGVFFACTAFVTSAYAAHLPGLLGALGAGVAGAIWAAALLGPAQVSARLLEFAVISRYRVHALVTAHVAAALHPVACGLLLVLGGPPLVAALFAVLHGAGNGMITIAKGTLPLALLGPAAYGLTQGWLAVGARLMGAAAPYAFGLVLEGWGGQAALLISAVVALLALAALGCLRGPERA